jgi:ATP-dependent DNA helicase DinG
MASLRLIQAAGRLLRTETDEGVVTILDKRLLSKRYGSQLLDALPPFRREI